MTYISEIKAYFQGFMQQIPLIRRDTTYVRDKLNRQNLDFLEDWQTEAINAAIWTETDPATNPNAIVVGSGLRFHRIWLVANETGRSRSVIRYLVTPNLNDLGNHIPVRFNLEWTMRLTDPTNLDPANCFFGLTKGVADDRTSQDIVGFGLDEDVGGVMTLTTITDRGGVEEENDGFGEVLTDWNKLRISIGSLNIKFYLNDYEISMHGHTADLPDQVCYLNFYGDSEGGAGPTYIDRGWIRTWAEDEV